MKKTVFKSNTFKWSLIVILLLLLAYNINSILHEEMLAYLRIPFQIILLIFIATSNKYTKDLLEGISLLYAIMIGLNLILIVIPLILFLIKPVNDLDENIYLSLFLTLVKLILSILVYKLSKTQTEVVTVEDNQNGKQ